MSIYEEAVDLLINKQNFAFATIITDRGSTPRSKGTKMIVRSDGSIYETIGGGSMEAACIEKAIQVIKNKETTIFEFNLTNKDAAKTDMICGGRGEILIDYIDYSDENNLEVFSKALQASKLGKKSWISVILGQEKSKYKGRELLFVDEKYNMVGKLKEDEFIKSSLVDTLNKVDNIKENSEIKILVDPINSFGKAYIFGGGHVSKYVAEVLNLLEFNTIVIDDRDEYANSERFPNSEVIVLDSLECIPELNICEDSYILIITRGHLHDSNVLEWALKTNAYYIGMIGSKTKAKLTYNKLYNKGFSEEQLKKVHSPIGIKLKAQTPAEIAISIGAELINCRADKVDN